MANVNIRILSQVNDHVLQILEDLSVPYRRHMHYGIVVPLQVKDADALISLLREEGIDTHVLDIEGNPVIERKIKRLRNTIGCSPWNPYFPVRAVLYLLNSQSSKPVDRRYCNDTHVSLYLREVIHESTIY